MKCRVTALIIVFSLLGFMVDNCLAQTEGAKEADRFSRLAKDLVRQGQYVEAVRMGQQILAIRTRVHGPDHHETGHALNDLANSFLITRKPAQALPLAQRALAIWEKEEGSDSHPDLALSTLAKSYLGLGDYPQAQTFAQKALKLREQILDPEHPDIAEALITLAQIYEAKGKFQGALPLAERALPIFEKHLGPDHIMTGVALAVQATLYKGIADYRRALEIAQRAVEIVGKAVGTENPMTAIALSQLASKGYLLDWTDHKV